MDADVSNLANKLHTHTHTELIHSVACGRSRWSGLGVGVGGLTGLEFGCVLQREI